MKKILAFILSGIMLLNLAACGSAVQDTASSPVPSDSTTAEPQTSTEKPVETVPEAQLLSSPKNPVSPKAATLNMYGEVEEPENAEGADYESIDAMREAQLKMYNEIRSSLTDYYDKSIARILTDTKGKNLVYSPVNVYLALAMLAEITNGNSREQLLSLLGQESAEELEKTAALLFLSCYAEDGKNSCTLGNSLWLAQDLNTNNDTVKKLAEHFYASVYRGIMGSDDMNEALRAWLNENTGKLLEDAVDDVTTKPDTIIALASAIYFKAAWEQAFSKEKTKTQAFHNASGQDKDCIFLTEDGTSQLYLGEKFTAWSKWMTDGSRMFFFLPDEGTSAEEVAASKEFLEFLHMDDDARYAMAKTVEVHAEIPKFDVSSDVDLISSLMALGITDVFSDQTADFSSILADYLPAEVDSVEHAARVKIDEDGCEAAAYTVIMVKNTSMFIGDTADFICDRPFLFTIENRNGATLFTGIVNEME